MAARDKADPSRRPPTLRERAWTSVRAHPILVPTVMLMLALVAYHVVGCRYSARRQSAVPRPSSTRIWRAEQEHARWVLEASKPRVSELQTQLQDIERARQATAETRKALDGAKAFARDVASGNVSICPRGLACIEGVPQDVAEDAPLAVIRAQDAVEQADAKYSELAPLEPTLNVQYQDAIREVDRVLEAYQEKAAIAEQGPYWNVTIKDTASARTSVLQRGTPYSVTLDLGAVIDPDALEARETQVPVLRPEGAEQLAVAGRTLSLNAFLVADSAHFEPVRNAGQTLNIALDRLRAWRSGGSGQTAPDFGQAVFEIRTRREAVGPGALTISIWQGTTAFVDEIKVPTCTAAADGSGCESPPQHVTLSGADDLHIAFDAAALAPDERPGAMLYFVQVAPGAPLTGVFARAGWQIRDYITWETNLTPDVWNGTFGDVFAKALGDSTTSNYLDNQFAARGEELEAQLFPPSDPGSAGLEAFHAFVREYYKDADTGDAASIYVRAIGNDGVALAPVPIALLPLPSTTGAEPDFLGFHFKVEGPLKYQSYATGDCLGKWVIAIPPKDAINFDTRLSDAVSRTQTIRQWKAQSLPTLLELGRWLRSGDPTTPDPPTAMIILAHHDSGQLWTTPDDKITIASLVRTFKSPSLVILDGCETAALGAAGFIERFNAAGMSATIATFATVPGHFAGDFLESFATLLSKASESAKAGDIYLKTIRALRTQKNDYKKDYGALALAYAFLGNGNLRLCRPVMAAASGGSGVTQ